MSYLKRKQEFKFEFEIMNEWVKEIKEIKTSSNLSKIIERTNYYYLGKIIDFRLRKFTKK